ncbi:hypothetical protein GH714_030727 [Hevea brasiliensis]|uniref:Pentacotripeptide-repeat region of PRORP domain-containing protein n=1 Tax=Hevea brasiliensis TaxID=3981 RepID=A0A6A6K7P0_HEVBR|nr:hypothetical protein GH714_030727 [Hevea brasiliensis]
MLNRLVRDRIFAPADHVRILMIKSCRNEEELKRVIEYLNGITANGVFGFTLYSFNTLLLQLGKFGLVTLAQNVYTQLLSSGVKPSLLTLNTMINIFCKEGKVQEAMNRNLDKAFEVFDWMVKDGCDPNSVTYSTLINALCNEGSIGEAMNMLGRND